MTQHRTTPPEAPSAQQSARFFRLATDLDPYQLHAFYRFLSIGVEPAFAEWLVSVGLGPVRFDDEAAAVAS